MREDVAITQTLSHGIARRAVTSSSSYWDAGALLNRVLDSGQLLRTSGSGDVDVSEIAIYDADPRSLIAAGALVLCANVTSEEQIAEAISRSAAAQAAAVVLRMNDLEKLETGLMIAEISDDVSWSTLYNDLRSLIAGTVAVGIGTGSDDGVTDLFILANAVSLRIGGPVIIEDRMMRLLAFSDGQDSADPSRVDTILRRRPSQAFVDHLQTSGLSDRLYAAIEPVYLEREVRLEEEGLMSPVYKGGSASYIERRVAIGVRAGGRELGAIWAAVNGPITEDLRRILRQGSDVAALHILRHEAHLTTSRERRAEVFRELLWPSRSFASAWQELGLRELDVYVAITCAAPSPLAVSERDLGEVAAAVETHFTAHGIPSAFGAVAGRCYGVLSLRNRPNAIETVVRLATTFRADAKFKGLSIGIGDLVTDPWQLEYSRNQADHAVRVSIESVDKVAQFSRVQMSALLLAIANDPGLTSTFVPAGPISKLKDHDERTSSELAETLRVYVSCLGSISLAAEKLHVHVNTLRHRVNRIMEITELDFNHPDTVAGVSLQLYLLAAMDRHRDS